MELSSFRNRAHDFHRVDRRERPASRSASFWAVCEFYGGDPGLGVLLVPVGAVLLLTALFLIASGLRAAPSRPVSVRKNAPR